MSMSLFAEPTLKQVTVWARGVLQNKEARDVVVALTEAAATEGKYVQAWENYIDLPDRVHVPVRAYAKVSEEPIFSKYVYENETPEIVLLCEETLVKNTVEAVGGARIWNGTKDAVLIVNTKRTPAEIAKFLAWVPAGSFKTLVTIDAFGYADQFFTYSGAEGATDASGIGHGIASPMLGALVKATNLVSKDAALAQVANKDAFNAGFNTATVADFASLKTA